jgi:hypothetical protein
MVVPLDCDIESLRAVSRRSSLSRSSIGAVYCVCDDTDVARGFFAVAFTKELSCSASSFWPRYMLWHLTENNAFETFNDSLHTFHMSLGTCLR